MRDSLSLYIHIPFCRHRCAYCDFNTYAGLSELIPAYVDALCAEIKGVAPNAAARQPAHTIFFGGGTPSLLSADQVEQVLAACRQGFDLSANAEITMEANPGTVSLEWLQRVHDLGVNRMSFGMQSAHPADLILLEREHETLDVIHSVEWSRQSGFENLSLDLIFGIPGQTLDRWAESLNFTIQLQPEHLSLYGLTVEPGTPFKRWVDRGLLDQPDDDLAADMYELACQRLEAASFAHYEISNWAKTGAEKTNYCMHNLQYWLLDPYLGFGAGAHGFAAGCRTANVRGVRSYIQRMTSRQWSGYPASPAAESVVTIDRWTEMQEMMMVGMRPLDLGVSAEGFENRFSIRLEDAFGRQIDRLSSDGLIEWAGENHDRLRLTRRGWLLGNRVFREFIGLPEPDWIA